MSSILLKHSNGKDRRSTALLLCRRGFSLLPLQPGRKEPAYSLLPKDPETGEDSWSQYREGRPATEAEIRGWFIMQPEINIGLITGQASGIAVVDVDKPELLPEDRELPDTLRVSTHRGYHLYYRTQGAVEEDKYPWGELKADGGYVVVPPSIHPDGGEYEWEDFRGDFTDAIAPAPQWIEPRSKLGIDASLPTGGLSLCLKNPKVISLARDMVDPQVDLSSYELVSLSQRPNSTIPHNPGRTSNVITNTVPRTTENIDGVFGGLGSRVKLTSKTAGGQWMEAHSTVPEVALRVLNELCGTQVERLGKAFLCPLHPEKNPSAALWQKPGGLIMLRDFHKATKTGQTTGKLTDDEGYIRWWPLPDLYAAVTTGKLRFLKSGERMTWWARALHQLGYIELGEDVHARPLPDPHDGRTYTYRREDEDGETHHYVVTQASVAKVYSGFQYLLQLRSRYDPDQRGTPFSHRFAAGWCNLSKHTVGKAMRYLMQNGLIRVLKKRSPKANLLDLGRTQQKHSDRKVNIQQPVNRNNRFQRTR